MRLIAALLDAQQLWAEHHSHRLMTYCQQLLSSHSLTPAAPPPAVLTLATLCSGLCCRKPHRKGLTPYYFAVEQAGLTGNEQFFYFTSLVRRQC